jgi:hypothetical protein
MAWGDFGLTLLGSMLGLCLGFTFALVAYPHIRRLFFGKEDDNE